MTYAVTFSQSARADLFGIVDYITKENPRRAISFVDALQARIRGKLELFPRSGTAVESFRFVVFSGYVAVYSIDEKASQVRVVLVAEGHRDWRTILKFRQ